MPSGSKQVEYFRSNPIKCVFFFICTHESVKKICLNGCLVGSSNALFGKIHVKSKVRWFSIVNIYYITVKKNPVDFTVKTGNQLPVHIP